MVRGVVGLPNGTGKTVRVAVFARGAKADEAKEAEPEAETEAEPEAKPEAAEEGDIEKLKVKD